MRRRKNLQHHLSSEVKMVWTWPPPAGDVDEDDDDPDGTARPVRVILVAHGFLECLLRQGIQPEGQLVHR